MLSVILSYVEKQMPDTDTYTLHAVVYKRTKCPDFQSGFVRVRAPSTVLGDSLTLVQRPTSFISRYLRSSYVSKTMGYPSKLHVVGSNPIRRKACSSFGRAAVIYIPPSSTYTYSDSPRYATWGARSLIGRVLSTRREVRVRIPPRCFVSRSKFGYLILID